MGDTAEQPGELAQEAPVYTFNASALALGGTLMRDNQKLIIPSIASVALSSAGGEGLVTYDNYNQDGISFSRAVSRVVGYEVAPRQYLTLANVSISNLNVRGRLQAAYMESTVISEREIKSPDPAFEATADRTKFRVRVMYRGVIISDDTLTQIPEYDAEITNCPDYATFVTDLLPKSKNPGRVLTIQAKSGPIHGSVLALDHGNAALAPRPPHKIPVRGFGRVHLGDFVVKPDRRRVSLFRIELDPSEGAGFLPPDPGAGGGFQPTDTDGAFMAVQLMADAASSGDSGSISGGETNSNGAPIWPGP